MSDSDVTIVITTKDRADMVDGAIRSALECRPAPARVLVVDSGSTDDTLDRLKTFGDSIDVIAADCRNAAEARNVGIRATETPFIGFLDSDDLMLGAKVSCLEPYLREHDDVGLVSGWTLVMDEQGRDDLALTALHARGYEEAQRRGTTYAALLRFNLLFSSATLMRRSSLLEIGGYDEENSDAEDLDLYLRLSLKCRLAYADCVTAKYRLWGGNYGYERSSRGQISIAEKHLAMLSDIPVEMRKAAELALLERAAAAHHRLLEEREARRAAVRAFRSQPLAALSSSTIRRTFLLSFVPQPILRKRGGP